MIKQTYLIWLIILETHNVAFSIMKTIDEELNTYTFRNFCVMNPDVNVEYYFVVY